MANATDPFTASIIPFEVPEQVRAFAEKGVSQARDNYAKFKDAAIALVDERENEARQRFELLKSEMTGRAADANLVRKDGSEL